MADPKGAAPDAGAHPNNVSIFDAPAILGATERVVERNEKVSHQWTHVHTGTVHVVRDDPAKAERAAVMQGRSQIQALSGVVRGLESALGMQDPAQARAAVAAATGALADLGLSGQMPGRGELEALDPAEQLKRILTWLRTEKLPGLLGRESIARGALTQTEIYSSDAPWDAATTASMAAERGRLLDQAAAAEAAGDGATAAMYYRAAAESARREAQRPGAVGKERHGVLTKRADELDRRASAVDQGVETITGGEQRGDCVLVADV
ncbi:MAG: hypothetical protein HYU66_07645 [Armatimonadetes bacterium]|nr:hypothetical protein [Armatimonadota bacterium]